MKITETDLEILRKCFMDSLGVVESEFYGEHIFKLKSSWNKNSGKTIGVLKNNIYFVHGYPKTNGEIVKYLMEHGHQNIVVKNTSDEPSKPFCYLG